MTAKRRIFISYQREHEEDITALVSVLEKEDAYDIWYDQKMSTGKWWDQIIEHIRWADVVILALSRSYLTSEACRREYQYAEDVQRAILPVIVDPNLAYEMIPEAIRSLQIEKYFGQADQYIRLRENLNQIALQPLPDPLPTPPDAPMNAAKPAAAAPTRRFNSPALIAVLVALILIVIVSLVIAAQSADNESGDPSASPSARTVQQTSLEQVETPPQVAPGHLAISLVYGGRDSLTVVVNEASNLNKVALRTFDPQNSTSFTEDFGALAATDAITTTGVCLIYETAGTDPRRPLGCENGQNLVMTLQPADVFWFNSDSNRYVDVAVYYAGNLIRLCPHANGSGRCDISAEAS